MSSIRNRFSLPNMSLKAKTPARRWAGGLRVDFGWQTKADPDCPWPETIAHQHADLVRGRAQFHDREVAAQLNATG